ncbi:MAG: NeuD/PglB/VioB family sugar acetyltransferase [Thermodesulfobacteriota bacterium]
MSQQILIIGTGAQAKYALEIFHLREVPVAGLISLPEETLTEKLDGADLLGNLDNFEDIYLKNRKPYLLLCCSKNKTKEELGKRLSKYSPGYINAIHPTAVIARTAVLGHGIIVNSNAVIQPYASIGNHVMIHAGVIIEHDCVIQDYVNLAPRVTLAGYVKIGKGATVYTGAVVAPKIEVGEYSVIGAGGVVLANVNDNVTVAGVPAHVTKTDSHRKKCTRS